MSLIKLEKINKIYKTPEEEVYALRDVSMEINNGDFVIIRGESGSGKSTLLNILGAIDSPTSGLYHFGDTCVSSMNDVKQSEFRRKNIGFVFQDYMLIQKQSVIYNVMVPALFGEDSLKECRRKAREALAKVGMSKFEKRKAYSLSGGQKQRVAIARALINNPSVILADEPTGALDSENSMQLFNVFKKLNDEGVTIVFVTHSNELKLERETGLYIKDGVVTQISSLND